MRKLYLVLLLAPAAAIYACGGDDSSNVDGGMDVTSGDSPSGDAGNDSGQDGSNNDAANNDGGQDAGSDVVQVSLSCLKPADCVDGGNPDAAYPPADAGVVCCGDITTAGTDITMCTLSSVSTACKSPSACPTTLDTSGCGMDQLRVCAHKSECTEGMGTVNAIDQCCTLKSGDAGATVCLSSTIATLLKASCLP
jgi:hypothetical protein